MPKYMRDQQKFVTYEVLAEYGEWVWLLRPDSKNYPISRVSRGLVEVEAPTPSLGDVVIQDGSSDRGVVVGFNQDGDPVVASVVNPRSKRAPEPARAVPKGELHIETEVQRSIRESKVIVPPGEGA